MAGVPMGGAIRQIHRLFVEGIVAGLADCELLDRFLTSGDEAAFAALVERHGPMVLGTCRAVLRDPDDAEDAFQATFLVLVCKARSIRGRGALGGWLHQVAHRIAIQAATEATRKRKRERCVAPPESTDGQPVERTTIGARSCRGAGATLGQIPAAPVIVPPGGKTTPRRRTSSTAARRPCGEVVRRPRAAPLPTAPSRHRSHDRSTGHDPLPLGTGESPARLGRGDRPGGRAHEFRGGADRRRRDRDDDGRDPGTQVLHSMLLGQCGRARPRSLFWSRSSGSLGSRDLSPGPRRESSSSPASSHLNGPGKHREARKSQRSYYLSRVVSSTRRDVLSAGPPCL